MMSRWQQMLVSIRFLRRPVGFICLAIAILGFVLPIIPGWPFIIPAILLLGRRDRGLRHMHLLLRRTLRWMRRSRVRWMRRLGVHFSSGYRITKRAVRPTLIAAERAMRLG